MPKEATAEELLRAEIGRRVRHIRTQRGLTQMQLGAKAGKEQAAISKIETGDYLTITVGLILDLAHALSCDPAEILSWPLGIMHVVEHQKARAAV